MTQLDVPPRSVARPRSAAWEHLRFRTVALGAVALLAALLAAGWLHGAGSERTAGPPPLPTAIQYDARGRIEPASQARLATLQGGTIISLAHAPGEAVQARDEIARLETASGGAEIVVAPFGGTVLAVLVRVGDGLLPGASIAVVGDLATLRVETTDVDEYLVASLRLGQPVDASIDALDGRVLAGRVTGITLAPQPTGAGDEHYPVYVALDRLDPALRPGMSARLRLRSPASTR